MKLSKKIIINTTALQSLLMITIFIIYNINTLQGLVISELLFASFISVIAAFSITVLIIVIAKMIKMEINKQIK